MSCAHARLILLRRQRFWHASTADPGLTLEWPAFGSARSCYFSAPGARPPSLTRALGSRALRLASRPLPSTTRGRAVARPQRLEAAGRGAQHEEKRGARHVCLRESGRLPGCGAKCLLPPRGSRVQSTVYRVAVHRCRVVAVSDDRDLSTRGHERQSHLANIPEAMTARRCE